MVLQWVGLVILLLLSGYFSGTETAFTSLSGAQIHDLKARFRRRGALIERLTARPDRLLTTILIGNNLVNIGAASLATVLATEIIGHYAAGVTTGVLTIVVLIFGEATPKQIAITNNEFVTLHTVRVIYALSILFAPVIILVTAVSNCITRLTGGDSTRGPTPEAIINLVKHAASIGAVGATESWIVRNIFRFRNVPVQVIMTHRTRVYSVGKTSVLNEVFEDIARTGYSRIPVYDDDPERIVGIVLAKDVMREVALGKGGHKIGDIMARPIYVPESRRLREMLAQFRGEQFHMAIVLDEYGGLAGIVTLEDVIEEVLGEIYDELDQPEGEKIELLADGSYQVQGDTPLYVFNDTVGTELPHQRHAQTIGGFLTHFLGRIPQPRERIDTEAGTFDVTEMAHRRVLAVQFHPKPSAEQEAREDND